MKTDSFVLTVNTKHFIKDLKNLDDLFDFSSFTKNRELFNKNKKMIRKFKTETTK